MARETREATGLGPSTELRDNLRRGVREVSGIWWWFLIVGVAWIWYGMFVLSYRVGSLAAVAALVGVAFLFGGAAGAARSDEIHGEDARECRQCGADVPSSNDEASQGSRVASGVIGVRPWSDHTRS